MIKRVTFALGLGLFAAMVLAAPPLPQADEKSAAVAKAGPMTGTIKSISGIKVEIAVEGEKPAWVKKGAGIKLSEIKGGVGKIVDVTATSVTFNTKKASELKVGAKVNLQKGPPAPAGC
jgi:hypothetical protein